MPLRTAGASIEPSPSAPVHVEAGCVAATSPAGSQRVRPMKEIATMPLHERDSVREQMEDCVFAGRDLTRPVAKYRFPRDESAPKEAFQVVGADRSWTRPAAKYSSPRNEQGPKEASRVWRTN